MTEEFDEDVVFENSPLFQYLQDLGHTDFEACPTVTPEDECGGGLEDVASPHDGPPKPPGGRLWRLAEALWRRSPFDQAAASQRLEKQLDCVLGQYSVRCILDQDVLLQEDVELIELLDPSLLTLGSSSSASCHTGSSPSTSSSRASTLPRPSLLASPSVWDMGVLVGLAAVLLGLRSVSEGMWSLAVGPWSLLLLGWMGLRGTGLWRQGTMQRAVHTRGSELQSLLQNSKALTGLSRKALRLVQETEVISRGFTLVSAASSFSRAGPGAGPRGQQLIGLRKAVYRALRSAFRASRRATCHMLKAYPLNSEIDNVTNYVSAVPLKELGLGLGVEHLSDEQAQELTDDYSLPALKVLFQLWVGQSSECFRRLALLLSPRRLEEEPPVEAMAAKGDASHPHTPPPPALHRSIATVTEPLHLALAGCLDEVQRSYDFHRYFETQPRTQGSDRVGRAREKCRELNTLHTSIRSLQLHLKALLSEMIILEDDLEKLMVSKAPAEVTCEGYQELSDRLQQLHPHMQASAGCWEDTLSQVERMLRRANACPGAGLASEHCPPPALPHVPPPPPSYPLILDRDPVPEEQELEAYVSESDSEDEWRGSACDMLSPAERERQRREREESRRVLSELKAVLGFRASEVERRKWKQLLFNDQAAVMPLLPDDPDAQPSDTLTPGGAEEDARPSEDTHPSEDRKDLSQGSKVISVSAAEPERQATESATEFSCGEAAVEKSEDGVGEAPPTDSDGGSRLYQYDGLPAEGAGQNGLDCHLKHRAPALSMMDRLTEIHGSAALGFTAAIAARAAGHSHAVGNTEELFGDDDDDDDDDEDEDEDEEERRVTDPRPED